MKKFFALFLAMMMIFSMAAMAETVKSPSADVVPSPEAPVVPSPEAPVVPSPEAPVIPSPDAPGVESPDAGDVVESPDAAVVAASDIKIGQVLYAAHGTKCFAVLTVAVQDDVIVAAYIDEFQFMDAATAIGVPNSDQGFGESFPEGKVLASKRVNSELYSASMAKAGSTVALADNYAAIEAYVTGMTIAELEAAIADKTAEEMVDAVSGATLADTLGYLQGLLAAAKAAQ